MGKWGDHGMWGLSFIVLGSTPFPEGPDTPCDSAPAGGWGGLPLAACTGDGQNKHLPGAALTQGLRGLGV